ncbi:MAG: TetR/AcrR family transcriptional regulator [Sneathiellales bacterium]|nr:TetR/AcrR family transcriptional regulator [Sneathiellales bacterium]
MARDPVLTRKRILEAANSLFYAEGIRAVSVDLIAERSGVTKKTIYYHFDSKDDLVAEWLVAQDQPHLLAFQRWFVEGKGDIADRVESLFRGMAKSSDHPKWYGCGFVRTIGELVNEPNHPALEVGAQHKKNIEKWLVSRLLAEGIRDAENTARQIALLMDGAFTAMMVHRDVHYIEAAGAAAANLVRHSKNP